MNRFLSRESVLRALLLTLVFLIPIGTKKFIGVLMSATYEYSRELSSIFLYATDVVLLAFVGVLVWRFRRSTPSREASGLLLAVFLCAALISVGMASNAGLAWYSLVRLLLVVTFAWGVGQAVRRGVVNVGAIATVVGTSAALQSLVAIFQFIYQKSVGLWFLGESVIALHTSGVARTVVEGVSFLRAYGTMPHANLLAAFLIFGILSFSYLILRNGTRSPRDSYFRVASAVGLFVTLLGLALTFSRSGWIIAALTAVFLVSAAFYKKEFRTKTKALLAVFALSIGALALVIGWVVAPRAGFSRGEVSIDHRVIYNEIGLDLIRAHPWGVGIGNQTTSAIAENLYKERGLVESWGWQPIHNLYLLVASELGIVGFFVFGAFIISLFSGFFRRYASLEFLYGALLLGSLLLFGLVDHFMWDIESGRLMFWLALGIMMGLRPRGSMDRTHPSEG